MYVCMCGRMCLMARLCDSCGPLRGGALASRLHCHAIHGDIQSTAVLVHRYTIKTKNLNANLTYVTFFLVCFPKGDGLGLLADIHNDCKVSVVYVYAHTYIHTYIYRRQSYRIV